jgi:hypothetical protein
MLEAQAEKNVGMRRSEVGDKFVALACCAPLPIIKSRFAVARLFWLQNGIGKTGIIKIAEGRSFERRANGNHRSQRRHETVAVGQRSSGPTTELRTVVNSKIGPATRVGLGEAGR